MHPLARRFLSSCGFAARHARYVSRARAKGGKKPEMWTPEEIGQQLGALEDQVDHGQSPDLEHLVKLLYPIRHQRNSEDLRRVLQVVQRSQVTLNESVGSALVSCLAEGERVADIKPVLQQMQGRLRVQSLASILLLACRKVDADLTLEYLAMWDSSKSIPEPLVGALVTLSWKSGRVEVMDSLLTILGELRQPVGMDSAAQFKLWAQSQPQPFLCEETTVSSSGVCTSCKAHLEKALTATDHQQLLEAVTTAAHTESLGFSPELISNLSRLENQLSSVHTPYRVIVDGLNVARVASKHFNVMQVMDVVNELTATLGGPVLVVARKHLAMEMDRLSLFYPSEPHNRDFHIFTTHINEISDDICVIYGALITGPSCYFVSNDQMSDNASLLSPYHARLFSTWQASRQIALLPAKVQLLYPADHSQAAQGTQTGWHIPLHHSLAPDSQDAWLLDGRQRWEYRESSAPWAMQERRRWLCIRTSGLEHA